jgi:PAS domain S-box-containing protein
MAVLPEDPGTGSSNPAGVAHPGIAELEDGGGLFRALFDFSNEAVLLTSPEGAIFAANPEACRLSRMTEAEICAGDREALLDTTHPGIPRFLEERRRNGSVRGEMRMKRGDGSVYPADVASALFRDQQGNPRTVTLFHDISDRKALEERTAWLAAIVESTDDAVIGKTLDGIITSWNKGATRLYGFTAEEMLGRTIALLIPADREKDAELQSIFARVRKGEMVPEFDTFRRRKDGSVIPVSLRVSPVLSPHGEPIGASTVARDISERLRAQAERDAMILELQQALAEVKTLSGLVPICSHCKKIRDDSGYWTQVEAYIQARSEAKFSHGLCPECIKLYFPDFKPRPAE